MSDDRFEHSYRVDGPCPICGGVTTQTARYPDAICRGCESRAVCCHGRALTAYNISLSGGFEAAHADDRATCADATDTHAVWIDGIECYMGEARFGGIVTQPAGS